MIPVIIPYYKKPEQLEKCLAHLERQTVKVESFVKDNNKENIYFTAAINEGIRNYLDKDCEYMVILNQDMYLEPHAVAEMVNFMDANPACGIVTPLQLKSAEPDTVIYAGGVSAFPNGYCECGPLSNFTVNKEIFWSSGACMLLRKEMIREIGLLDKNMLLVCSDSDYCFTARSRDWKIFNIVSARGVHEHGVTSNCNNPDIELIKMKDTIYFADKWLTGGLYKKLSFEGAKLTQEAVRTAIEQLKRSRNSILIKKNSI